MELKTDKYGIQYYDFIPPGWKRVAHYTEFQQLKPVLPKNKKDWDAVSLRFLSNTEVEPKDMPEQVLQLMYVTKKQFDGIDFTLDQAEELAKKRLIVWEKMLLKYEYNDMDRKVDEAINFISAYHDMFEWIEGIEYLTKSPFSGNVFYNILTRRTEYTILAEHIKQGMVFIKDPDYVEKTDGTPYWL